MSFDEAGSDFCCGVEDMPVSMSFVVRTEVVVGVCDDDN